MCSHKYALLQNYPKVLHDLKYHMTLTYDLYTEQVLKGMVITDD